MARAAALLLLAALAWGLAACGGGGDGPPVPQIQEASSERLVSAGGQQVSTITIRMDRDFELARANVPLASRIELDVPDLITGETRRVLVASAEIAKDEPRTILVQVEALVPDGSKIRIDRRAFSSKATGELRADITSSLSPAFAVLATTAFQPLKSDFYAEPRVPDVRDADRDPVAMRAELEEHLKNRGTNETLRMKALQRYDAIPEAIVPSPKMRAALAGLTGTFADPAYDYLLTDQNCTRQPAGLIAFQPPPDEPDLLGRSTRDDKGARVISLNPGTEGDRIEHIMALLAHEAIHCDQRDGRFEEIAATAFDTFLYMQLLAVDPSLASSNSPLARDLNVDIVAMINSGRAVPESVGILKSPNVSRALPGSNSGAPSFGDLVIAAYPGVEINESRDEPLANAYVELLAQQAGMMAGSAFDLVYLDELLGKAMPPGALGEALQAFQMAPAS